uniref:Uncharacterized protein n=1 Tax=Siphoviridae sp. ctfWC31 TaxID=2826414 RepID=A0A8S5N675_9CAUD|nr:MAG TPA: hypothetical protein [Siphoviridae sp. ctfWC31]
MFSRKTTSKANNKPLDAIFKSNNANNLINALCVEKK